MSQLFDDQKLSLACLKCGHKFEETVRRLQSNAEYRYTCPACGDVSVFDTREFRAKLKDADKAVDKLRQAFKKFGK